MKYTIFPIEYPSLWSLYKKSIALFWTTDEIDFADDYKEFQKLNKGEKHFIKSILCFFAGSDSIVIENLALNFLTNTEIQEVKSFYSSQILIETIHSETYSLLIDTLIRDKEEKNRLFNGINNNEFIRKKAEWCFQYINKDCSLQEKLIAFACVEGIFFSGAFCSIYWLKYRNYNIKGLIFSNELISRDEALHTEFAIEYYKHLEKLPSYTIHNIISDAVDVEKYFICDALPCRLLGMNTKLMSEYIEFVADRLALQLGISKIYNTNNPFDFMETISLEGKTNFFEKRVAEYSKAEGGCKDINFDECFV
jgi:ribonucleotide reductase beta subunit family protein with ferritin-like domain